MPQMKPMAGEWMSFRQARMILGLSPYRIMKLAADRIIESKRSDEGNTLLFRPDVLKEARRLARGRAAKRPAKK